MSIRGPGGGGSLGRWHLDISAVYGRQSTTIIIMPQVSLFVVIAVADVDCSRSLATSGRDPCLSLQHCFRKLEVSVYWRADIRCNAAEVSVFGHASRFHLFAGMLKGAIHCKPRLDSPENNTCIVYKYIYTKHTTGIKNNTT